MTEIARTDRLVLREVEDSDFQNLLEMFNDAEVMKFYRMLRDEKMTKLWIEFSKDNYRRLGHSKWIIERADNGEFVGYCGLLVYPVDGKPEIELGYMLKRSAWGQGYATEAASACLSLARAKFGYARVVSVIDTENATARRVAERIGMKFERDYVEDSIARVIYSVRLSSSN